MLSPGPREGIREIPPCAMFIGHRSDRSVGLDEQVAGVAETDLGVTGDVALAAGSYGSTISNGSFSKSGGNSERTCVL